MFIIPDCVCYVGVEEVVEEEDTTEGVITEDEAMTDIMTTTRMAAPGTNKIGEAIGRADTIKADRAMVTDHREIMDTEAECITQGLDVMAVPTVIKETIDISRTVGTTTNSHTVTITTDSSACLRMLRVLLYVVRSVEDTSCVHARIYKIYIYNVSLFIYFQDSIKKMLIS